MDEVEHVFDILDGADISVNDMILSADLFTIDNIYDMNIAFLFQEREDKSDTYELGVPAMTDDELFATAEMLTEDMFRTMPHDGLVKVIGVDVAEHVVIFDVLVPMTDETHMVGVPRHDDNERHLVRRLNQFKQDIRS